MDLRKEIRLVLGKLITESNDDKITFDDVPDMYAIESLSFKKQRDGWRIYKDNSRPSSADVVLKVGHLSTTGYLFVPIRYLSGRISMSNTKIHFGDDLHNAMRYLYLKSKDVSSETISEAEGDRYDFSDVGGYFVVERKTQYYVKGKIRKYWTIHDKKGNQLGNVSYDGNLAYFDEHRVAQYPKDITFKTDESGLKQAARYVYLKMAPKKKTLEENKKVFPNIGGWYAKPSVADPDMFIWILSDKDEGMGALVRRNNGTSELFFNRVNDEQNISRPISGYRSGDLYRKRWKNKTPWNFWDVENAVRYVYMKSQKVPEVVSEEKLDWNRRIRSTYIKGLKGWKAMFDEPHTISIIDPSNEIVGQLTSKNVLNYNKKYKGEGSYLYFLNKTDWDFNDYENATKFLWLKSRQHSTQKDLRESKNEEHILNGQQMEFPEIGGFYAQGMLTKGQIDYAKSKDTDGFIYAFLHGPDGEDLGWLDTSGAIAISAQITSSRHQEKSEMIFPVNIEGVKNALRYLYLNTHSGSKPLAKKISENDNDDRNDIKQGMVGKEEKEVIELPEFGGWTATAERFTDMDDDGNWVDVEWVIRNSEGEEIGYIINDGVLNYITDEFVENWNQSDINFNENPRGAASFIWLKKQQRAKQLMAGMSVNESAENIAECGKVVRFEEMPGLRAYYQCDRNGKYKQWVIYTGKSPFSGNIVGIMQTESTVDASSTGQLLWKPERHSDYELAGDFKGDIKNAIRFVWLNMRQNKDVRFRKTGRYDEQLSESETSISDSDISEFTLGYNIGDTVHLKGTQYFARLDFRGSSNENIEWNILKKDKNGKLWNTGELRPDSWISHHETIKGERELIVRGLNPNQPRKSNIETIKNFKGDVFQAMRYIFLKKFK